MERLVLVAVSILWIGGLAALGYVALTSGEESDDAPRPTRAELVPEADVRSCGARGGGRLEPAEGRDTMIGPVTFIDSAGTYRGSFRGRAYVAPDYLPGLNAHPMEVVALVDAGRQVRLVVPRTQRRWMRLLYRGDDSTQPAITLESCQRSNSTFGGGMYVDFDNAPQGGRCAELEVQLPGEARIHRGRVFGPRRGECREIPVRVSPGRGGRSGTTFGFAFRSGARLGTAGRRRQGYRVAVRGPDQNACVTDDEAFADRGRPGQRLVVRLDPRRAPGKRWCRGRFRGRLFQYSTFACPSRGACRRPANFPAREREVGRFSFTVR